MKADINHEKPEPKRAIWRNVSTIAGRFIRDETGATAIEYAILAAAIAAVIVTVVASLGLEVVDSLSVSFLTS